MSKNKHEKHSDEHYEESKTRAEDKIEEETAAKSEMFLSIQPLE